MLLVTLAYIKPVKLKKREKTKRKTVEAITSILKEISRI